MIQCAIYGRESKLNVDDSAQFLYSVEEDISVLDCRLQRRKMDTTGLMMMYEKGVTRCDLHYISFCFLKT